jgi:hypothetical protein
MGIRLHYAEAQERERLLVLVAAEEKIPPHLFDNHIDLVGC